MLQVFFISAADMPLDIPQVERCWDPMYWAEADDEAACAAGSGALQHESSELPDGDEAAFLHIAQAAGSWRCSPRALFRCLSSISSLTPALL